MSVTEGVANVRFVLPRRPAGSSNRVRVLQRAQAGFTLIELLVVVGLIALLAAGIGFSLVDRRGNTVASAQRSIFALCGAARAQAALHQAEARLLIYAQPPSGGDATRFLRLLQVHRAEPAGSQNWIPAGPPVYLPRGIFVVPPNVHELVASGIVWPSGGELRSNLEKLEEPLVSGGSELAGASSLLALEFDAAGLPVRADDKSSIYVWVAPARVTESEPRFDLPAAARGIVIRPSGAIGFVHGPTEM